MSVIAAHTLAFGGGNKQDAAAIAALPDYVAEVDRLRAWLDWLENRDASTSIAAIRDGAWPPGVLR